MERAADRLRNLNPEWWNSEDMVIGVARILDDFGSFESPADVLSYFMQPWEWMSEIDDIVRDVGRREPFLRRVARFIT